MKTYKIVDRKAPRFRRSKYRYNIINKELWERFMLETGIEISWAKFKSINEYINLEIRDVVLNSRDGVILPEQIGHMWLGLFKTNERVLNEPHIRNTGQHATFFSFETSGMQGKICWDFLKVKYKVKNHELWGFVGHRDFKTKASKQFKENPELYSRINNITQIEERIKKNKLEENELNLEGGNISNKDTE